MTGSKTAPEVSAAAVTTAPRAVPAREAVPAVRETTLALASRPERATDEPMERPAVVMSRVVVNARVAPDLATLAAAVVVEVRVPRRDSGRVAVDGSPDW